MVENSPYEMEHNFEYDKPREACGVYGVFQPGANDLAQQAYIGLLELQHRGQDAAGIALIGPDNIFIDFLRWSTDYEDWMLDIHNANFAEDNDGNIVILDPVVAESLLSKLYPERMKVF